MDPHPSESESNVLCAVGSGATRLKLVRPIKLGGGASAASGKGTVNNTDEPRASVGFAFAAAQDVTVPPRLFQTRSWNVARSVESPSTPGTEGEAPAGGIT